MKRSRSHETSITIDAPIADVWKAISEAGELQRWLAKDMEVTPRVCGSYMAKWDDNPPLTLTVEVWDAPKHLQLVELEEGHRLLLDYYLESEGNATVLRVVQSGFGSSKEWDSEYDGTRHGWPAMLLRLKIGLERHRGESVHNISVKFKPGDWTLADAWSRVDAALPTTEEELFRMENSVCKLAGGRNVLLASVGKTKAGPPIVYLYALLFGKSDSEAAAFESEWTAKLPSLFVVR